MKLVSGYDRSKNKKAKEYRAMTIEEAKTLAAGSRVPFLANDGTVRDLKINGAVKTWKRDSSRVEVPVKYGLYECGCLRGNADGTMPHLLVCLE